MTLSEILEYVFDWKEATSPFCPFCDGASDYVGAVGNHDHFRCKNCGYEHSRFVGTEEAK